MASVPSSHSSSVAAAASAHAAGDRSVAASAVPPSQGRSVHTSQGGVSAALQSLNQRRAGSNGSGAASAWYQAGGSSAVAQAPPASAGQSRGAWKASLSAQSSRNSGAAAASEHADGDLSVAASAVPPAASGGLGGWDASLEASMGNASAIAPPSSSGSRGESTPPPKLVLGSDAAREWAKTYWDEWEEKRAEYKRENPDAASSEGDYDSKINCKIKTVDHPLYTSQYAGFRDAWFEENDRRREEGEPLLPPAMYEPPNILTPAQIAERWREYDEKRKGVSSRSDSESDVDSP